MREPKNQMLGTMEPPLMQLSVKGALDKCNIIPNCFQKKLGFLYH